MTTIDMAMPTLGYLAQQNGLGTGGIQKWIVDNLLPLLLLSVALLLLWLGGTKGDNAGVMRRVIGVFVALGIVGFAMTGAGVDVGKWLAGLFSG
jgi:Na+-transporting methylmalonyl-CoA/oxaloacetate decarboxylase beta subunit